MRKFKLLVLVFVVGTMGLFANNIDTPTVSKDEIRSQIVELLNDNNANLTSETYVNVVFTFNTAGEIVVLKVESMDKEVLTYIRENLNGKTIERPGKIKREYKMPISVQAA